MTPEVLETRRLLRDFLPKATAELMRIATEGPVSARLGALKEILDRLLGRPESRAEVEHISGADERAARAFALELVRQHPELAERYMRRELPAGEVVDVLPEKEPAK